MRFGSACLMEQPRHASPSVDAAATKSVTKQKSNRHKMNKLLSFTVALVLAACSTATLRSENNDPMLNQTAYIQTGEELFNAFDGDVRALLGCARDQQRAVIVAHRGGAAPGFPENAAETMERAIENLPVILEFDVRHSADGVNYLHHDGTLDRTTTGSGTFDSLEWDTLSGLNLRDNGYQITEFSPIDMRSALDRFGTRVFLMFDLKAPADTAALIREVTARGRLSSSIFIAYNTEQAREILDAAPDAFIALGVGMPGQVEQIKAAGLFDRPFLALGGPLGKGNPHYAEILNEGHFILNGSYNGDNPPDTQLEIRDEVPAFDAIRKNSVQIVASNRPFEVLHYLKAHDLLLDVRQCR